MSTTTTGFGRSTSRREVTSAVLATLLGTDEQREQVDLGGFLEVYLRDQERRHGLEVGGGEIVRPRSWGYSSDGRELPEGALPCITVWSEGHPTPPARNGREPRRAVWRVQVETWVTGSSIEDATLAADIYGAAIKLLLEQCPVMTVEQGLIDQTVIEDIYPDVANRSVADVRYLACAVVVLDVTVGGYTQPGPGPFRNPPVDPGTIPDDPPDVTGVFVTVKPRGPIE